MNASHDAARARFFWKIFLAAWVASLYMGVLSCGSSNNSNTPSPSTPPQVAPGGSPSPTPSISPSPSPSPNPSGSPSPSPLPVALGQWGGRHAVLHVETTRSTLKTECGLGKIAQPLDTDIDGNFQVTGTYTSTSGPIVVGQPTAFPAIYFGNVSENEMFLTVQYTNAYGDLTEMDYRLFYQGEPDMNQLCPEN